MRVDLTEDITMQALGVCGGIMDVFVERVPRLTPITGLSDRLGTVAMRAIGGARSGKSDGAGDRDERPILVGEAADLAGSRATGVAGVGAREAQVVADARAVLESRQHRLLRYPEC